MKQISHFFEKLLTFECVFKYNVKEHTFKFFVYEILREGG